MKVYACLINTHSREEGEREELHMQCKVVKQEVVEGREGNANQRSRREVPELNIHL